MIDSLLQNNTAVKIFSVFIAFIVWLYISGDSGNMAELGGSRTFIRVPVTCENLEDYMKIVETTGEVDVNVRGEPEDLADLTPDELNLYVDLGGLREGAHLLTVKGEPPAGVRIHNISPNKINVVIGEIITRQMEVKAILNGDLDPDYIITGVQLEPSTVIVQGTRAVLSLLEELWGIIDVDGVDTSLRKSIQVMAVNRGGEKLEGLEINPGEVDARVEVNYPEREVAVEVVFSGELPPGFEAGEVALNPDLVTLVGPGRTLEEIDKLQSVPVDLTGREESFYTSLEIQLPQGTSLRGISRPTARVEIIVPPAGEGGAP